MPLKGLFNQNEKNEELQKLKEKIELLEQQVLKINTLEVHVKRFLKMEPQLQRRAYSFNQDKEKKETTITPPSDRNNESNQQTMRAMENRILSKISKLIFQELTPINQKINFLEDSLMSIEKEYLQIKEIVGKNQQYTAEMDSRIERKLSEKVNQIKNEQPPIIIHEIKVDKVMLDKYEQTNNFGQLGIKELRGELNIGATYGKGIIPSALADDWKEDLEGAKHNTENEKGQNKPGSTNENMEQDPETDFEHFDEESSFIEIPIEDMDDIDES